MTTTRITIAAQIRAAQANIHLLKSVTPNVFPEYARLVAAHQAVQDAERELLYAEEAWRQVGKPKT